MKVKFVKAYKEYKAGEIVTFKDSFGLRLVEQGKAVFVKEARKAATADKTTENK